MSSKLLLHRSALNNAVKRIAMEAGELILEYFDGVRDMQTTSKGDGSPVTLADREAEELIEAKLLELLPDIPVLGEESHANGRRVNFSEYEYFWLVDPLDGTRAFVKGEEDFTVNIGLIHKSEPVLGVVYAPEKGELYSGFINNDGTPHASRFFEESRKEKELRTRKMPSQGLTVLTGGDFAAIEDREKLLGHLKVATAVRRSSSIKICMVANGKADIYPRLGPTGEWDTAAGHAILKAAGGDIRTLEGESLKYGRNTNDAMLNPHFVAASDDVLEQYGYAPVE